MPENILLNYAKVEATLIAGLPNGSTVKITNTTSHRDPEVRIGTLPFQIAIFKNTFNVDNLIPFGTAVGFDEFGVVIMSMPSASINGIAIGDDNKVITRIAVKNNSGGAIDLPFITGARVFSGLTAQE